MKCIKLTKLVRMSKVENASEAGHPIKRVSNEFAAKLVKKGDAVYVPKSEWKATGRH